MTTVASEILDRLAALGVHPDGVAADSRAVRPGDLFLAYPGSRADGRRFIAQAIAAGAAAVVWEREAFAWDAGLTLPNVGVEGLKRLAGPLAAEVLGRPSAQMWIVGVTGTNGKTSCSQWIAQALSDAGRRTAVIGTLGLGFPGALEDNPNTTPDAVVIQHALRRFADAGAQAVSMEVSSIGLDQGRVEGVQFGAALFTNLSRDHLDYHPDMASYSAAKQRLFRMPGLRHAVLNLDDPLGVTIANGLADSGVERVGYTLANGAGRRAGLERHIEALDVRLSQAGIAFRVASSWGEAEVESALLGRFNVANLLGVLGVLLVSGLPLDAAVRSVAALAPVPGRMERVGGDGRPLAVVDYAHSPDALDKVLRALSDVARARHGRLICVFGCGGQRDRGKRPLMGEAASRHANFVVVTSDNPRDEDPEAIIRDILPGVSVKHVVHLDRREAIRAAVRAARPADVILIAGKGHEPYQEIAGIRHPFADLEEARVAIDEHGAPASREPAHCGDGAC